MKHSNGILQAFVLESQKRFNEFNINEAKRISKEVALNELSSTRLSGIDVPLNFIADIQKVQYEVSENNADLAEFFERIYTSPKICTVPVSVLVFDISEISKIKPEYIREYMETVKRMINDALNDKLSEKELLKFISPEFYGKLKKQLVVSTLPEFIGDKDIVKYNNKMVQKIDSNYISTIILPFLRATEYRNKQLFTLGSDIVSTIKRAISDMNIYGETVARLTSEGKNKNPKAVSAILAYGSSILFKLSKYISSMYIRKISLVINNNEEYIELRHKLLRYFPNGERELHESVIDGESNDIRDEDIVYSLINGQGDIYTSIYGKIYNKYKSDMAISQGNELGDDLHSLIDTEVDATVYDQAPYKNTGYILNRVDKGLKTFANLLLDPDESLETIVSDSGLDRSLFDEVTHLVDHIESTKFYAKNECIEDGEIYTAILNELKHGAGIIEKLAAIIKMVYDKFLSIQSSVKDNVNGIYTNTTRNTETITWLREFETDFRNMLLQIGKAYINRADSLKECIGEVSDNKRITIDDMLKESPDDDIEDYTETAFELLYDYNEECTVEAVNEIINDAKASRIYNYQKSSIMFEADGDNNNNNTTDNNSDNNNNNTDNTNNNQNGNTDNNKNNDKPTLVDNSNDNSNDNNNNTSNNDNNNSNNKSGEGISKLIEDLIQRIVNGFAKAGNKKKLELINANKDYLMNKKYVNIRVDNIHKFQTDLSFSTALSNISNAVSSISATDKKENITKNYLAKTSKPSNTNTSDLGNEFIKYYKFKDGDDSKSSLSDSALGDLVKRSEMGMVDFCVNYYSNFSDTLSRESKNIQNNIKSLSDKLKDNSEKDGIMSEISTLVQKDIGAIGVAYRDIANEYYNYVLKKLIDGNPANKNTNNTNNNENNNSNENNNNTENK